MESGINLTILQPNIRHFFLFHSAFISEEYGLVCAFFLIMLNFKLHIVQILGTGMDTQDTSPSVLLFFDKQRFIFNAGEVSLLDFS